MHVLKYCQACACAITVEHVKKERDVRGDSSRVVIIFKCPNCGITDRLIPRRDVWAHHLEEHDLSKAGADKIIMLFLLDLELFDTVDELQTLWRSYRWPPPLEKGKKRAG